MIKPDRQTERTYQIQRPGEGKMGESGSKTAAFRCGTLLYYNQVLREKELITEQEYRQMQRKIRQSDQRKEADS